MCYVNGDQERKCQYPLCQRTGGVKLLEGRLQAEKIPLWGGRSITVKPGEEVVVCYWCAVLQDHDDVSITSSQLATIYYPVKKEE